MSIRNFALDNVGSTASVLALILGIFLALTNPDQRNTALWFIFISLWIASISWPLQRAREYGQKLLDLLAAIESLKESVLEYDQKKGETPSTFADEYDEKKSNIDGTKKPKSTQSANYTINLELEEKQREYFHRAAQLWSSISLPDAYRSAYYYALAAYACIKLGECPKAGLYYHFAGHKFRELREYEYAGMCYKWSGDLYKNDVTKKTNALRSYTRALMAFSNVGEQHVSKEIKDLVDPLTEEVEPSVDKLFWWCHPGAFRK